MSLQPHLPGPVPAETARVAHAAFPKSTLCLRLRDELGSIYTDPLFAPLFPARGQPALAPWQLALVTLLQFVEGLTDRQAADQVRSRIDWKYLLGLDLTDPGFDFSVLCEFRARLVAGGGEQHFLDALLDQAQAHGWLKARGTQRTDATHVLAAIRTLTRLELVGETMRAALNSVAVVAPDWLQAQSAPAWPERYGHRVESYRLPKEPAAVQHLATQIGADGRHLLTAIYAPTAPPWLREVPAVAVLRQVWVQQFVVEDDQVRWRSAEEVPPSSRLICSPYDSEARYSTKRSTSWTGYKVHLTETCDPAAPHLITQVETTLATLPDGAALPAIQQDLAARELLPATQLVDSAYVDAAGLVRSQAAHGVELCGPAPADTQWQQRAGAGCGVQQFGIDWEAQTVTCPQGQVSSQWFAVQDSRGKPAVRVRFARATCQACAVRGACTQATRTGRQLLLRPQAEHAALQAARERQTSAAFKAQYAQRAGVEGTLSQGVRSGGLRASRYRGLAKTHLQHMLTAAALNVERLWAWWTETPGAPRPPVRLAMLAA